MMSRGGLLPLGHHAGLPAMGPLAVGPLGGLGSLGHGLFHHRLDEDYEGPTTPPLSTMTTLEDLALHYRYSLYPYLPQLPPPGLPLPSGLPPTMMPLGPALAPGLGSGMRYEPLSLMTTATPPPLDLSVKTTTPATPITPPSTPSPASPSSRKRLHESVTPVKLEPSNNNDDSAVNHNVHNVHNVSVAGLPPSKRPPSAAKPTATVAPAKKMKAVRKLNFDEDKSSPVSGTIIRDIGEVLDSELVVRKGDIDPAFNVVEVTEEAKAEIAAIENKIGDYVCRLCRELYDDAFALAQHRCSCIVHVEYRCPECDKVFNCPANLASHRRWHKPKQTAAPSLADSKQASKLDEQEQPDAKEADASLPQIPCPVCNKRFRRQAYLRKHLATHSSSVPGFSTLENNIMGMNMSMDMPLQLTAAN
ncbi:insulinoma-associated protein 1a-like [Thrips palmi]|uniref:Insulinoma-associated protein 1a-like n=1 Tax=Thrips palmi TaxID=161013 RepID=A0A6P8YE15_THRPL|nr:insulinoma-associated protein 1a-like [Thrips palmi]